MKYRADYLADAPKPLQAGDALITIDRGVTTLIHADTDEAAHQLALLNVPPDMALHSVYRVEVREHERRELRDKIAKLPEYGFGELHDTIALLLNALNETDSELERLRPVVAAAHKLLEARESYTSGLMQGAHYLDLQGRQMLCDNAERELKEAVADAS